MSRKGVVLIVVPLFCIFLQVFLRLILKKDLNTIGITLGSLGLGQLLPFFYFDHFVANKLLGITPSYQMTNDSFTINYKIRSGVEITQEVVDRLKNLFMVATFFNLGLFLVIVYLGITQHIGLHIFFGLISCVISWYLLIFKND